MEQFAPRHRPSNPSCEFLRPWNAKPDAGELAPGIPPAPLWASEAGGVDQVGVIFGTDLVVRQNTWVGVPGASKNSMIERGGGEPYIDCVKNAYRVLMTRLGLPEIQRSD